MVDVSVIIVSYNSAKELKKCIESVLIQKEIQLDIIVVDNASQDNSSEILKSFEDKINVIFSAENLGFGKANNLAFSQAKSTYIFLLNPDAYFEDEYALKKLIDCLVLHPSCGMLAPRMLNEDETKETFPKYKYTDLPENYQLFSNLPGKIAWVLAAAILMPREVVIKISGFDEGFFLYAEDVDICLRIRQTGYEILQMTDVIVKHIGGASETNCYERTIRKHKALCAFYKKHYPSEVVIYLLKKDRMRSFFKMWYCFFLRMVNRKMAIENKYLKYKAIYETSREALK
jgi:GT2 family glycosyltransferase